ncbi:hypothetical protein ACLSZ3_08655 [Avibacterium gallinarum]|uniref:hypothetical protein n=1 Tax=Avibacterium gallinarum TaxID=755 RepID=UPI003BF835D0
MKKLLILFLSIFLTACAPKFSAYKAKQDNFSPGVEHFFSGDIAFQENDLGGPGVGMFKIHTYKKSSKLDWGLSTRWISLSSRWLFVNKIAFNIDGKIYTFDSMPSPLRQVISFGGVGVEEINNFSVTNEFIKQLITAKSIIVRVSGSHFYLERTLTIEDINNIKWYITYIESGNEPNQN